MRFHRNGLQSETFRVYIQILVRHEKEIILLSRPQTSQTGKYHQFFLLEHLPEFLQEIRKDIFGQILAYIV